MGLFISIVVLIAFIFIIWWDWENPDKKSVAFGSWDSETVRLNNERKDRQIYEIEKKIADLNKKNPGRIFYRDGPRIREHSPEEVNELNFNKSEYERLNAPYPRHQRRYFLKEGKLVYIGDDGVRRYKFEEKMRKINRDNKSGILCEFDHKNMKLINKITKEEIPFDPDSYELTGN